MLFTETTFLLCIFPALLVIYFNPFFRSIRFKNTVLIMFSIIFYLWGEPLFVYVMIISAFLNWLIGMLIEKYPQKGTFFLGIGVTYDLGLLFIYKYLSFITENIAYLTKNNSIVVRIALPIGISFFTFQMLSYIIDVKRQTVQAQRNPLYVLLYVALFPQLIAGPIVRYSTIEKEIRERHELPEEFTLGMRRFIFGLGKKMLLSNYLGLTADALIGTMQPLSVASAWLGAVCYSLQILFDFSGYSDMAIGLGLIFGFHFPENFNYPYIAKSITAFWRRWHISLSSWFRDYVYIPLGGSRVAKPRLLLNLLAVWLLTGIWHGANWTFVVWGLGYFVLLTVEKFIGYQSIEQHKVFSHCYTMFFVILLWVVFRCDSIPDALTYWGYMFGIGATGFIDADCIASFSTIKWILLPALLLATPLCSFVASKLPKNFVSVLTAAGTLAVFCLSVIACISATEVPFIYFNF